MSAFRSSAFSRKLLLSCVAALPLAMAAQDVMAQVGPSSVRPERVGERLQQANPAAPQSQPAVAAPDTNPVPVASNLRKSMSQPFVLRAVQVDESTVYPAGTFNSLFDGKIGKKTSVDELRAIARGITNRYRQDGYVLSQAVIPNQSLAGGVFHIRVVEGFVDQVIVKMDDPSVDSRGLVQGYGKKISQIRPLNTKDLERYMLLANDLPGMKAKALLRPSPGTFGAADLVIEVTTKTLGASFTADNRGNKFLGPYQGQATVTENSLLGLGERTTIRGINTVPYKELHFFDIQHEQQLDHEGTRVIARAGFTRTRPGDYLKSLDLNGEANNYSLSVTHPFIRARAHNLNGHVTYDALDTENNAFGTRITNDRVRALRGGLSYDTTDSWDGSNLISGEASQGLAWFNATSRGLGRSNAIATPNYLKFNLDASRIQSLPYGFSVLTAATSQVSSNALPTSEQFALGGVGYGQAFDGGEISGDQGLAGKVELRYGDAVGASYLDSYQLYTYYDIGKAWTRQPAASTPGQQSLASVGAGIRANINENFYGYLEAGLPLTRDVNSEGDRDPRFFFSVTGRY